MMKLFSTLFSLFFITYFLSFSLASESYDDNSNSYIVIRIWHSGLRNIERGHWVPGENVKEISSHEVGHVSLETSKHYISLWPGEDRSRSTFIVTPDNIEHIVKAPALFAQSYNQDIESENNRHADRTFCLNTLRCDLLNKAYEEIQKIHLDDKIYWSLKGKGQKEDDILLHNCSSIVRYLLKESNIHKIFELKLFDVNEESLKRERSSKKVKYFPPARSFDAAVMPAMMEAAGDDSFVKFLNKLVLEEEVAAANINSYWNTFFINELDFYTPSQITATVYFASVGEAIERAGENAEKRKIALEVKDTSNDKYIRFEADGPKRFNKQDIDQQSLRNKTRKFDRNSIWSWFSIRSWMRWSSNEG